MFTYICTPKQIREHSSAGSEHLPYKQRVRGSNPCAPTKVTILVTFFYFNLTLLDLTTVDIPLVSVHVAAIISFTMQTFI